MILDAESLTSEHLNVFLF